MARRLEGQRFIADYNNGVRAIAHELVWTHYQRCTEIVRRLTGDEIVRRLANEGLTESMLVNTLEDALHSTDGPVFTFASPERVAESPWFTGDFTLLEKLCKYIESEGGIIKGTGLYVPFSNGLEVGFHGAEAQAEELAWVTNGWQFFQTFGITVEALELMAVAKK